MMDNGCLSEINYLMRLIIINYSQNVVIPGLSSQDELLVGRCLILGSNFCSVISPDVVEHFIRATAECLQPDRSMILKILATKAMASFVSQSTENENLKKVDNQV
jgi:hypothetical protein